ncbi:LA_3334 family protein [Leptospira sarikeiensis]|uniref:Uncharacterized protein n=1 Tax=Leptospira sarikeiensis TaxID=2484943 RepID=A0A4R9KCI8_9LEPT|nr:hypothetical protein [Leptospira sarikeiensis]TGL64639.1 hypothetical protein EHQ64_01975 [Leptospira sarikeiensis]
MPKTTVVSIFWILLLPIPLLSFEILLKNGDAFISEVITEEPSHIIVQWKEKKYKIPRSEIQRLDPRKKGADSSYRYSEWKLTDGTVLKGILIEKKENKLVLKTELGFAEIEKNKILSQNFEETFSEPPQIPEQYLFISGSSSNWRIGIYGIGSYSWGAWSHSFPITYGGGGFVEKDTDSKLWFYGFSSELSGGKGNHGNISLWSQSFYLGRNYGNSSSPYWILGAGASSITRTYEDEKTSALTPDLILEFGWSWKTNTRSEIRLGVRSQCSLDGESSLCRSGVKFSWGFAI